MALGIANTEVESLLYEVAQREILPLWKKLRNQDIEEKTPGEVVTSVDRASEEYLTSRLLKILPNSLVVGEEAAHANPAVLEALNSKSPVWVIDPLDGTKNYAEGRATFAVMICLIYLGETVKAWLYNPLEGILTHAEKGSGAFQGRKRLNVENKTKLLSDMSGALLTRFLPDSLRPAAENSASSFREISKSGCAGHDYTDFVSQKMDFLFYYRTLVWDHAPGILIAEEAGAHVRRFDGSPYRPTDKLKGLLCASSLESWQLIHKALLPNVETNQ